jgi:hypothetical protein
MPDRYLARAQSDSDTPPNPLISAGLTIAVPLVVGIVGWALLNTIALDNSTGHAVSYSGVRSAITQALEKDLAADRLQDQVEQASCLRVARGGRARPTRVPKQTESAP